MWAERHRQDLLNNSRSLLLGRQFSRSRERPIRKTGRLCSATDGWSGCTNSCRYSAGLAPYTLRKTPAKCCWLLNPHATATSSTRLSAARNISLARSILRCNTNWCGLWPVDWPNICEKWVMLKPAASASSSRLKSPSISVCTSSTTFRRRAGVNPPR